MSKNCSIMKRMKENYEVRSRHYLTRRMPVIMRIDGKAFHTYTRGLDKPFDEGLIKDMVEATKYLCANIQGAKCGYVQSDEISILLTDYDNIGTNAWFDYEVQKMCSVAASHCATKFMQMRLMRACYEGLESNFPCLSQNEIEKFSLADFDCRVFNLPKEEVANYFLARQKDAVKNSISMLAQSLYSHKELHKKNSSELQEMCFQKGYNWHGLHYSKKRGIFVIKNTYVNKELVEHGVHVDKDGNAFIWEKEDSEGIQEVKEVIVNPVVRSRWESVETPMTFNVDNFKHFIKL